MRTRTSPRPSRDSRPSGGKIARGPAQLTPELRDIISAHADDLRLQAQWWQIVKPALDQIGEYMETIGRAAEADNMTPEEMLRLMVAVDDAADPMGRAAEVVTAALAREEGGAL